MSTRHIRPWMDDHDDYNDFINDDRGYPDPSNMADADYLALSKMFRDPGGESALGPGPRTEPCPTCERPNRLTKRDVAKGYQCDSCANQAERGY
jgi:hypothetical protein